MKRKMRTWRRCLALALAFCTALTMAPTAAFAEGESADAAVITDVELTDVVLSYEPGDSPAASAKVKDGAHFKVYEEYWNICERVDEHTTSSTATWSSNSYYMDSLAEDKKFSVFEKNKFYQFGINLRADEGYSFAENKEELNITVNGKPYTQNGALGIYDSDKDGTLDALHIPFIAELGAYGPVDKVCLWDLLFNDYFAGDQPKSSAQLWADRGNEDEASAGKFEGIGFVDNSLDLAYEFWEEVEKKPDGTLEPVAYWYSDEAKNSELQDGQRITAFEEGKTYRYGVSVRGGDALTAFAENCSVELSGGDAEYGDGEADPDKYGVLYLNPDNVKNDTTSLTVYVKTVEMTAEPVEPEPDPDDPGPAPNYRYVRLYDEDGAVDIYDGNKEVTPPAGASYDKGTNTLTLNNFNMPGYQLTTNEMGSDFKIRVTGSNQLGSIFIYGIGNGSLEICGSGSLTLNQNKEWDEAITLEAESFASQITIDSDVSLTAYKGTGSGSVISILDSNLESAPITVKGTLQQPLALSEDSGALYGRRVISISNLDDTRWLTPVKKDDDSDHNYAYGISYTGSESDRQYYFDLFRIVDCEAMGTAHTIGVCTDQIEIGTSEELPSGFTSIPDAEGKQYTVLDRYSGASGYVLKKTNEASQEDKYVYMSTGISYDEGVAASTWGVFELGPEFEVYDTSSKKTLHIYVPGAPVEGAPSYTGSPFGTDMYKPVDDDPDYDFATAPTGYYSYYFTNDVVIVNAAAAPTPNPGTPTPTPNPGTPTPNPGTAAQTPAKGDTLTSGDTQYLVTSATGNNNTVEYAGTSDKNATSVKVPDTVTIGTTTYKVTSIDEGAFKNNKKLTTVKLGNNVTSIGANAFLNCSKLKTVKLGNNVTSIGAKAFSKCSKLTKITIPAKTSKIGKQAFSGCKNLKTITIKSTKLTKKSVSKKAFSGIGNKTKIKVPKKKLAAYKKLFRSKGLGKKVKVTK